MSDPSTWTNWAAVQRATEGDGVGFVLSEADTICCVDLDDALDGEGMLLPWTEDLLVGCPPTFLEVSPSGRGLHVWGHGVVGRGRSMPWGAGRVEVYDRGRYMTVTGVRYDDAPNRLADVSGWVGELIG